MPVSGIGAVVSRAGDRVPSWGFPILPPFRLLVPVQQRALPGSQARGTGRSFPAFGAELLQGEGGTGRGGRGARAAEGLGRLVLPVLELDKGEMASGVVPPVWGWGQGNAERVG